MMLRAHAVPGLELCIEAGVRRESRGRSRSTRGGVAPTPLPRLNCHSPTVYTCA